MGWDENQTGKLKYCPKGKLPNKTSYDGNPIVTAKIDRCINNSGKFGTIEKPHDIPQPPTRLLPPPPKQDLLHCFSMSSCAKPYSRLTCFQICFLICFLVGE